MKKEIRLDKYLSQVSGESRNEVKGWLKKGRVTVNQEKERDPGRKICPEEDRITLDGRSLTHHRYHYLMLHKPAGLVSATRDDRERTVLDLILNEEASHRWNEDPFGMAAYSEVFPVGRLDKDTEGLLLLTDDGDLSHQLLSPRKHVTKCYFALLDGRTGREEEEAFAQGLDIGDEKKTLPAGLRPASAEECEKEYSGEIRGYGVYITIEEGRYHQVKRMARAVGREVLYLKRVSMGGLRLDPDLQAGCCRPLTEEELELLQSGRS